MVRGRVGAMLCVEARQEDERGGDVETDRVEVGRHIRERDSREPADAQCVDDLKDPVARPFLLVISGGIGVDPVAVTEEEAREHADEDDGEGASIGRQVNHLGEDENEVADEAAEPRHEHDYRVMGEDERMVDVPTLDIVLTRREGCRDRGCIEDDRREEHRIEQGVHQEGRLDARRLEQIDEDACKARADEGLRATEDGADDADEKGQERGGPAEHANPFSEGASTVDVRLGRMEHVDLPQFKLAVDIGLVHGLDRADPHTAPGAGLA